MIDIKAAEKYVAAHQPEIINLLADFALTDVVLFWNNTDNELAVKQKLQWRPILDWLKNEYKINMLPTFDFSISSQNQKARLSLKKLYETLYLKELTAFYLAATTLKSTTLGLALTKKHLEAEQAFELSFLEELHQNIFWGKDHETVKNREKIKKDLLQIEEYLNN